MHVYNIIMVEIIDSSNLLSVSKGIICHQTNCIGVMGGGIALQIKNKWPIVFKAYRNECDIFKDDPKRLLSHVQDVVVNDELIVANCYGQVFPGNGLMTDYNAWDIILDKLGDLSHFFNLDLHFPWMIGCGLAGGDWNIMQKKIEDAFGQSKIKVYIHKLV